MTKIDISKDKDVFKAYSKLDFDDIKKRYRDPATKYAFDVLEKRILAGYHIQLACFRHVRDLQKQNSEDLPFFYDIKSVANLLKFAEMCPEAERCETNCETDERKIKTPPAHFFNQGEHAHSLLFLKARKLKIF